MKDLHYPMRFARLSRLFTAISFLACITSAALGQIQVFGSHKGKRLPVVAYNDRSLVVVYEGLHERNYDTNDIVVRAAKTFAEGFVTISDTHAELDLLQHASAKERADPRSVRARYRAAVTADRKLSDCYGLLTFVSQGTIGTRLVEIGRLEPGQNKTVEVDIRSDISSVGSLHVFVEGNELRSNQHPDAYDVVKEHAEMVKDVRGISAAELVKLEETYPHRLSIDASRFATIRKRGANKAILIYDIQSMQKVSETVVAGVDDYVGDLTWVSNDQLVYIAPVRDQGMPYKHCLFRLDATKGTTKQVLDEMANVITSQADHPEIIEVKSQNQLFMKYDVLAGKTFDQEDPDAGLYYFDAQGKARVKISYRGDKKYYEFRPTPTSRWQDLDDAVKQPGLKFNQTGANALDSVVDVHSVGPDGDTLYISTRLGSDTFQLAAFSMSQGVIIKTIAKHPKYDLTTRDGGDSKLLFTTRSTRLLGMVFEAQKPRVTWIEPQYVAVQKSIDASLPDNVNLPLDWSTDGTTFIYFSYSDRDPGTYYLLQTKTGELVPLMQLNERLQGKALGQTKPIEIAARDGQKIPGYVTFPPETSAQPGGELPPLLVLVHGGPTMRDSWGFNSTNQFFATRGYVVLQVNYRGSSGYGAAFQAAGLRARLDTVVLDDIVDGVRELIAKHQVDPQRVAIAGASFGGWATYMCLAKYPELFRTGIAMSAVTSWQKTLKDIKWSLSDGYEYTFWRALLERQDYETNAKYIDPLLRAGEIKQPIFIIHGSRDPVVSPAEADLMLQALKKNGAPVEVKAFPDAGHSYWPFADRVEMLNEMGAFLERNLPPAGGEAKTAALTR